MLDLLDLFWTDPKKMFNFDRSKFVFDLKKAKASQQNKIQVRSNIFPIEPKFDNGFSLLSYVSYILVVKMSPISDVSKSDNCD